MSDLVGRTLGHYRIVEQIGAGGMGVVYRAHDERLDRDVAIKVLPEALAQDPERLARFEREAKVLASLNDPHIAHLYGIETVKVPQNVILREAGGQPKDLGGGRETRGHPHPDPSTRDSAAADSLAQDDIFAARGTVLFLVMELVEGNTLAERITRGPIPVDDALEVACQIAEGLAAAHGQGIIHRDLKPANVMLSPEDRVKILDFGLAKAWVNEFSDVDLTHSPTITAEMTASGALMGTAAYMSPEQARGKRVDKRTDIWAFGCVLYEMLTGRRAFPGEGLSETMAAILKEEPDWGALPPETSATVKRVLGRCLQKDPNRRLHDIADARIAIEEKGGNDEDLDQTVAASGRKSTSRTAAVAVGALLAITAASFGVKWLTRTAPQGPLAVQIETIEALPENVGITNHIAISPDGKHLLYVVGELLDKHLVHRPLDQFGAKAIPGSEGARLPVFSPDGRWVAFSVDGELNTLKKVSLEGGQPIDLCTDCGGPATWNPDGRHILFAQKGSLMRVPSAGGEVTVVRQSADDQQRFSRPVYLPDGRAVLLEIYDGPGFGNRAIGVLDLETNRLEILFSNGSNPSYAASGHLLFARGSELFAVAFDAANRKCTGEPVRVRDDISFISRGNAQYSISRDGLLAFVEWSPASWTSDDKSLVWIDRSGAATQATSRRDAFNSLSLSPDCTRVAVAIVEEHGLSQIEIFGIETATWSRLTTGGKYKSGPVWSPDGTQIAFTDNSSGFYQVYSTPSDFSSDESERLFEHPTHAYPSSFSPAGDLIFSERVGAKKVDILRLPADGGAVHDVVRGPFRETGGKVSPDGRWLAYISDRSGVDEIYVEPFPEGGPRTQVSDDGGSRPIWARGGEEFFYLNGAQLIAVPVRTDPDFAITGERRVLFEHDACRSEVYDADCDGHRFLMVQPGDDMGLELRARQRVNLIFNFFEELERLVPTK